MCLEGFTVTHEAFGQGQVLSADEHYITVRFAGMDKTFVYPDAFKAFMTITDEEAMSAVRADLQRSDEEHARKEEIRRRERESERAKGVVVPGYQPPQDASSPFATVPDEPID